MMKSRSFVPASHTQYAAGITLLLRIFLTVLFVIYSAFYLRVHDSRYALKLAECLALLALGFLPRLLKLEHSRSAAVFALFLFFAGALGSVLDLFETLSFYDVFTHLFCGVVLVFFARDIVPLLHLPARKSVFVGFALVLTVCTACLWEIYEFVAFSILKNTSFSFSCLAVQFGFSAAKETAASALRGSVDFSYQTVQGLIENAYDTFCDVICALLSGTVTALLLARKIPAAAAGKKSF